MPLLWNFLSVETIPSVINFSIYDQRCANFFHHPSEKKHPHKRIWAGVQSGGGGVWRKNPSPALKGTVSRDFLLLVFFLIQFPPGLWKNLKRSKWNTLELGGNWFMKKTRSKKSCDTVPLTWPCALYCMHYSVLSQKISSELIKSITAIQ
jgi:hypothetical protein